MGARVQEAALVLERVVAEPVQEVARALEPEGVPVQEEAPQEVEAVVT